LATAALAAAGVGADAEDLAVERIPAGYRVEIIATPPDVAMEVGGMDFAPDGSLYVSTRFGEVWRYREGEWAKFADGLHEALGVLTDPKTGGVFVAQKPELTELRDTDGDGIADLYRTVCDAWGMSTNYH